MPSASRDRRLAHERSGCVSTVSAASPRSASSAMRVVEIPDEQRHERPGRRASAVGDDVDPARVGELPADLALSWARDRRDGRRSARTSPRGIEVGHCDAGEERRRSPSCAESRASSPTQLGSRFLQVKMMWKRLGRIDGNTSLTIRFEEDACPVIGSADLSGLRREVGDVHGRARRVPEAAGRDADAELREAAVEHDPAMRRAVHPGAARSPPAVRRCPCPRRDPRPAGRGRGGCAVQALAPCGVPASWSSSPSASSRRACLAAERARPACSRSGPQPWSARTLLIESSTERLRARWARASALDDGPP